MNLIAWGVWVVCVVFSLIALVVQIRRDRRWMGLLLLLPSVANAQIAEFQTQMQKCTPTSCSYANKVGTAVCISNEGNGNWLFVTSGHQVQSSKGYQWTGKGKVALGGRWHGAEYLGDGNKQNIDVSVWRVKSFTRDMKAYSIASVSPQVGAQVKHIGLGNNRWDDHQSKITKVNETRITSTHPSVHGHSGGPLLKGDCVQGLIWGTDGDQTYAVPPEKVCFIVRMFSPSYQCRCRPVAPRPPAKPVAQPNQDLQKRIKDLESALAGLKIPQPLPQRVVIVRNGEKVADKTYSVGSPIVIKLDDLEPRTQGN